LGGVEKKFSQGFGGKYKENIPLGRPSYRWDFNIEMNYKAVA
jgi:hypothetical protein